MDVTPTAYKVDHFIYRLNRETKGREGRCSRCGVRFLKNDLVRITPVLFVHGWWHETCDALSASAEQVSDH